jgi:hypothetical protein
MAFAVSSISLEERSLRERAAGRLLGQLGPQGYVVLSDGVVVGPTGVVVVTSLTCTDRLQVHLGELWHGRFPMRNELARARRALSEVREVVDRLHPGLPVRWMGCVLGTTVPSDPYCTLDLELAGPSELAGLIEAGPRVLDFEDGLRLAHLLDPARRRRSAWRSSRWRSR